MIAHIDLNNVVIGHQIARQYAEVVQAAKQTMNENDGELLCRFCADCARMFNFMAKFFFRSVGLGYYVDHSATGLQPLRFTPSFCQPGLTLSAVGICSYNPNDLYSAKTSHWIKMKTIEVDDELYSYIASHTKHIGESASDILRRMLKFSATTQPTASAVKGRLRRNPLPKRNRSTR